MLWFGDANDFGHEHVGDEHNRDRDVDADDAADDDDVVDDDDDDDGDDDDDYYDFRDADANDLGDEHVGDEDNSLFSWWWW